MSIIYENFSSLPVGSPLTPPGWTVSFGSTLIQMGIKTDNPSSHVCKLGGTLYQYEEWPAPQNGTLQFWFAVTQGSIGLPVLCQLVSTQVSNNAQFPLVTLFGENDASLTIRINGVFVGNTGINNFYFQQGVFYWVQLNFSLATYGDNEIYFPLVQLGINGVKLIDGSVPHTGVFSTNVQAAITGVSFQGALTGFTQLAEITFAAPNETIPDYPNQATTYNARASQGILELSIDPFSANARVSQGIIEHGDLPNRANARVSQGVIEIAAYTKVPVAGKGWIIKEV